MKNANVRAIELLSELSEESIRVCQDGKSLANDDMREYGLILCFV